MNEAEILLNAADSLKLVMKQKNISNRELARRSGVSERAIVRWRTGESWPRVENVAAISEVLNANASDLLGGAIWKK